MTLLVYPTLPGLTFPILKAAEFDTLSQVAANKYETDLPQTVNPLWSWQLIYDFIRDFPYGSFTITELRTLLDFFLFQQGRAGVFLLLDPDDNYVGPAMVGGSPNVPLAQLQLVNDGVGNYYSPLQRTLGRLFYEDITDLNTSGSGGSALAVYANGALQAGSGGSATYSLLGPGLALPTVSYMGLYLKWISPAAWVASHAYALNAEILDPSGHVQKATTAGTSGSAAPTFNDAGGTTPDGTGSLVWTDQGYNPGPAAPITAQFNFYFRCRFEMDSQDMEKFSQALWTIGGSESQKGTGQIKLQQARPNPL